MDECLPHDLRHLFPQHELHSTDWAGLKGMTNGHLLTAAETKGYAAFLTVDQGIGYQNNLRSRKIAVIVIRSKTNQLEDLAPFAKLIELSLSSINPGEVATIEQTLD